MSENIYEDEADYPIERLAIRITEERLKELIFQALGEASTCWQNLSGAGVFDSERAIAIGERLISDLLDGDR